MNGLTAHLVPIEKEGHDKGDLLRDALGILCIAPTAWPRKSMASPVQLLICDEGAEVKEGDRVCAKNGAVRYVTKVNRNGKTFTDDGIKSNQQPSIYCHFLDYTKIVAAYPAISGVQPFTQIREYVEAGEGCTVEYKWVEYYGEKHGGKYPDLINVDEKGSFLFKVTPAKATIRQTYEFEKGILGFDKTYKSFPMKNQKEPTYYNTGISKWQYGEQIPNDANVHLGPCPKCGTITQSYGGGWKCLAMYCIHNLSLFNRNPPKPTWWNTNIQVVKDGNSWCAHDDTFTDLQNSEAAFGDTPDEAVQAFLKLSEPAAKATFTEKDLKAGTVIKGITDKNYVWTGEELHAHVRDVLKSLNEGKCEILKQYTESDLHRGMRIATPDCNSFTLTGFESKEDTQYFLSLLNNGTWQVLPKEEVPVPDELKELWKQADKQYEETGFAQWPTNLNKQVVIHPPVDKSVIGFDTPADVNASEMIKELAGITDNGNLYDMMKQAYIAGFRKCEQLNKPTNEVIYELDCFEKKQHKDDTGDCQTCGHYLCAQCKHIASFDTMELWDNRERYYPEQNKVNH